MILILIYLVSLFNLLLSFFILQEILFIICIKLLNKMFEEHDAYF